MDKTDKNSCPLELMFYWEEKQGFVPSKIYSQLELKLYEESKAGKRIATVAACSSSQMGIRKT